MNLATTIYTFDLLGVAVFAITGALAAAERRMDILTFVLFGTLTGVGGGTLRDVLLHTDHIFWIVDTTYLWACLAASIATWFLAHRFESRRQLLLWADAMGLALFSVLGTQKALAWNAPVIVAIGMGMMTASFGSLLRDTLIGRPPVILNPEIYGTAALLGASSFVLLNAFSISAPVALPLSIAAAFLLRAAALLYDLRLPKYQQRSKS
ncbi:trimeric intracellular cation channel family protein [Parahaliea sp. F7430]|uniref:Trimeric intracellular cation channel family protein n=1 Tax=Sediminihaliea albiluteola TaxID=2758564 RepID=A0A7W2YIL0_9GAMM|nr:trimeric intracellular cation channel family protein [Sediminihaliea albiluteola]MBA6412220.1 trimeric intracellular cation channel family protein [Sediminihaliea albiluteola]